MPHIAGLVGATTKHTIRLARQCGDNNALLGSQFSPLIRSAIPLLGGLCLVGEASSDDGKRGAHAAGLPW